MEAASWLTPSMRQPSPAMTQVRWSTRSSPNRAARWRSAIAIPTAVAMPWPRGPVVVSTPGVCPNSGCPGVLEPHCRKFRIWSMVIALNPVRCSRA